LSRRIICSYLESNGEREREISSCCLKPAFHRCNTLFYYSGDVEDAGDAIGATWDGSMEITPPIFDGSGVSIFVFDVFSSCHLNLKFTMDA
jgi:hypothetical protein